MLCTPKKLELQSQNEKIKIKKSAIVYQLQMRVVKKTTMKKRLWFFFAMFSTSACNSYLTKFNQNDVRSNRVSFRRVPLMSWMQCTLLRHQRLWFNFCQIQPPSPISFVVIKLPMDGSQAWARYVGVFLMLFGTFFMFFTKFYQLNVHIKVRVSLANL